MTSSPPPRILRDEGLAALLEQVTRIHIIGDNPKEYFADEWVASLQDEGKTLKLFAYGEGTAAKAERDMSLVHDLIVRVQHRADDT